MLKNVDIVDLFIIYVSKIISRHIINYFFKFVKFYYCRKNQTLSIIKEKIVKISTNMFYKYIVSQGCINMEDDNKQADIEIITEKELADIEKLLDQVDEEHFID